ncbi:MAG: hypothetical protein HBSAPP04_14580 [Ignavibacteriaceae bacterium]|nr:MAG: hypothetical protein HBSAPP04_14580 [Ignavibacteriaceae bacterium]
MKIKAITGNQKYTLESALTDLAFYTTEVQKREAVLNLKITKLKEQFEQETADQRVKISDLQAEIEAFCKANQDEFKKKKSIEFPSGIVGFRTATPKISTLNRKYTFKTALELVKRIFPGSYVRQKEELDKEVMLADYSQKKLDDTKLASVGLRVEQEENFYVELKTERLGAQ